jgi:hypothetical protein
MLYHYIVTDLVQKREKYLWLMSLFRERTILKTHQEVRRTDVYTTETRTLHYFEYMYKSFPGG